MFLAQAHSGAYAAELGGRRWPRLSHMNGRMDEWEKQGSVHVVGVGTRSESQACWGFAHHYLVPDPRLANVKLEPLAWNRDPEQPGN